MVEFKVVVNDTKNGKAHQVQVSGHHANSLIGKKIGDEVVQINMKVTKHSSKPIESLISAKKDEGTSEGQPKEEEKKEEQ